MSKRELLIEGLRKVYISLNGPKYADNYVNSIQDIDTPTLIWSYNCFGRRSRSARYDSSYNK